MLQQKSGRSHQRALRVSVNHFVCRNRSRTCAIECGIGISRGGISLDLLLVLTLPGSSVQIAGGWAAQNGAKAGIYRKQPRLELPQQLNRCGNIVKPVSFRECDFKGPYRNLTCTAQVPGSRLGTKSTSGSCVSRAQSGQSTCTTWRLHVHVDYNAPGIYLALCGTDTYLTRVQASSLAVQIRLSEFNLDCFQRMIIVNPDADTWHR
jgi:hypothetical protein